MASEFSRMSLYVTVDIVCVCVRACVCDLNNVAGEFSWICDSWHCVSRWPWLRGCGVWSTIPTCDSWHCLRVCLGDPDSVAGEFGRLSLYKMLGYFSLVGLLRLHSLLGDYYQALKVLENVNFNKKVSAHQWVVLGAIKFMNIFLFYKIYIIYVMKTSTNVRWIHLLLVLEAILIHSDGSKWNCIVLFWEHQMTLYRDDPL